MKFAIRVSRLPPAVIYATIRRPPEMVVEGLNESIKPGIFGTMQEIHDWLIGDILCDYFEIEEDATIVFTDKRDADVLIIKTDKGFEIQ